MEAFRRDATGHQMNRFGMPLHKPKDMIMKPILRRMTLLIAATLSLIVAGALPAPAITGGEPDGNRHPNVALIAFYLDGNGPYTCSATLISPTVLLTAGHCTVGTSGVTLVTFDPVIAEEPPFPLPFAADPTVGYTAEELEAADQLWGTPTAHTEVNFMDRSRLNDVGIIVLHDRVTTITPATLAPVGYLDQFKSPRLSKTLFELVGYGTEVRKAETGPQKPQPMAYPLIRRTTTSPGQKLTPYILQLQGNPNDNRGGGGTCFGDSGGPVFLNGYLVAVTSYGFNGICRYIDGYQRVDTALVQNWLIP
ncbi:trypsin-like serine protease [Arthrobacter burdickii]|uniref:trypsin n=1 Tax=Arthrobacter burdickii TaxID=3035920 RepID=A0ABT8K4D8_9MICC|nr:trypsin-like serine protease [Arthrobacter burdickii]MDN4612300.1 trypsin-like serine protease [Arthrobacter burdickii]